MNSTSDYQENEIKSWLKCALVNEDFLDFSVTPVGNSEKGDGYMGDIVFVTVTGETTNHAVKTLNLVLKCSKNSQALRDNLPVNESFENEIQFYHNILPDFTQFQKEKGITEVFNSLPKYYGNFTCENREVVVLEDLKMSGYSLFDRKKPLETSHLKLILQEYGKLHAISAAMQNQEPERFQKLVDGTKNAWKEFAVKTDPEMFFGPAIEEIYEVLARHLPKSTADKLKKFKKQIPFILKEVIQDTTCFSVITHGDCWNNNFMFKDENGSQGKSLKVALLDFQVARLCNPTTDLSYFIYACASEAALSTFDELLKIYYNSFSNYLKLLGSDSEILYPFSQLCKDFKFYGKHGAMMTMVVMKVALSEQEEAPDFAETAESGFEKTFSFKNKDQAILKNRTLYLIEHIASQNIL